ncbi:unnamed protein product [Urochloa humidicola]
MAMAPQPLVGAVLSPSHGPCAFTSRAIVPPSNRRAAAVPHRRRRSSSARCAISTVNSNGRLAEADRATAAVATVGLQDLQSPLLRRDRHAEETITMIARVTVHTDSILQDPGKWSFGSIADILFRPNWLRLELVSSELDPKTGKEWETEISSYAQNHGRHDDVEFTMVLEASFAVPVSFGPVGAVRVVNEHSREMEIGDIKVFREGEESSDAVTFHCNSWVHPADKRTFFPLKSYLPSQTPEGVARLRKEELEAIRGDGHGERARLRLRPVQRPRRPRP